MGGLLAGPSDGPFPLHSQGVVYLCPVDSQYTDLFPLCVNGVELSILRYPTGPPNTKDRGSGQRQLAPCSRSSEGGFQSCLPSHLIPFEGDGCWLVTRSGVIHPAVPCARGLGRGLYSHRTLTGSTVQPCMHVSRCL